MDSESANLPASIKVTDDVSPSEHTINQVIATTASLLATQLPTDFIRPEDIIENGQDIIEELSGQVTPPQDDDNDSVSTCSSSADDVQKFLRFKHGVDEAKRLMQVYSLRENFSEKLENRPYLHPHGCANFDYRNMPKDRKVGFESFKMKVRIENYKYLRDHKEIRSILHIFLKKLLLAKPSDPVSFLVDFMTSLEDGGDMQQALKKEMKAVSEYRCNVLQAKRWINMGEGWLDGEEDEETSIPSVPPSPTQKPCVVCPECCICYKGKAMRIIDYEALMIKIAKEEALERALRAKMMAAEVADFPLEAIYYRYEDLKQASTTNLDPCGCKK